MKRLFIGIALLTITLVSCRKDWTCDCSGNNNIVFSKEIRDTSRKQAVSECEGQYITETNDTLTCVLN